MTKTDARAEDLKTAFDELSDLLAEDCVSLDRAEAEILGTDLFPDEEQTLPGGIVKPRSAQDVATCLALAAKHGLIVTPRGGGMSYTGGYRGPGQHILLDLRNLNKVRELNCDDRYMVVEAGCTWQSLSEALNGTGLRAALRGPISGSISTIGGAASQNLPGSMDPVLGLEVVMPSGEILQTGAMGVEGAKPFYRNFGPDLTGMFLGDAGAFGVKTALALRLEPVPQGVAHASFGFRTMSQAADAMVRIAANVPGGRILALDPLKNKTSTKVGMREGIGTLKSVIGAGGLRRGLKDAAKIALAGQSAFDDVAWSVHLTFEGVSDHAAQELLAKAKSICAENGTEIEPSIPVAMYAGRYSVRGFLGIKGERWVPLHGIFPLSSAQEVVAEVEQFFSKRAAEFLCRDVVHSYMLAANGPHLLIEPMFYWQDKILPIQEASLEERKLSKLTSFPDDPATRAWVRQTRNELRDLLYRLGGVSAQIGRYYAYQDSLKPAALSFLEGLKASMDPSHILNPGALGLNTKEN